MDMVVQLGDFTPPRGGLYSSMFVFVTICSCSYNPYLDFALVLTTNMETQTFQENLEDIQYEIYGEVESIFNNTRF